MQAMVHAKTCIQCGLCPAVCPDVFTLDNLLNISFN